MEKIFKRAKGGKIMRKKFLLMMAALTIATAPIAAAQEVTVEGVGRDQDSATRDAVRIAVEQVAGTYLNADTLVKDLAVEIDEIYKKSQGFVKSIKLINQTQTAEGYRVRALIDVDTDPNGKLMNELAMIYRLNDPRIAVIVFQDDALTGGVKRNGTAMTAMSSKLLSMGFSHVVDAEQVIRLNDAYLLNEIYGNREPLSSIVEKDTAIDYVVLGRLEGYVNATQVPNAREGGMISTGMNGARANLTCRVIKYDTGTLIGTFQTEGSGLDGVDQRATEIAIKQASTSAAEELSKTFRRFGAVATDKIQFIVMTGDYDALDQLRRDLLNTDGVANAHIREYRNGKAVIDVESSHKSNVLVQLLRQHSSLSIFITGVSDGTVQISIG